LHAARAARSLCESSTIQFVSHHTCRCRIAHAAHRRTLTKTLERALRLQQWLPLREVVARVWMSAFMVIPSVHVREMSACLRAWLSLSATSILVNSCSTPKPSLYRTMLAALRTVTICGKDAHSSRPAICCKCFAQHLQLSRCILRNVWGFDTRHVNHDVASGVESDQKLGLCALISPRTRPGSTNARASRRPTWRARCTNKCGSFAKSCMHFCCMRTSKLVHRTVVVQL
jgi:hypothetical protein